MQVTSYKSQATSYKLHATRYKLQVTSYKSQVTSHKLQVTYELVIAQGVTSYKSQVTSYKLQVTNYQQHRHPRVAHLVHEVADRRRDLRRYKLPVTSYAGTAQMDSVFLVSSGLMTSVDSAGRRNWEV